MSKKNEVKNWRDDLIVSLVLIIGLACIGCYAGSFIGKLIADRQAEEIINRYELEEGAVPDLELLLTKSKEAMNEYKYFAAYLELSVTSEEEVSNNFYSFRTDRDKTGVSYTYCSLDEIVDTNSVEYWCVNPDASDEVENDDYLIWIWSSEADSFVKTTYGSEPVQFKSWDIFDDMDYMLESYYIDEENHSQNFGTFDTPCWVVTTMGYVGENEETILAQSIFISKETLLPLGVISQSSSGTLTAENGSVNAPNSTVSSYEFTWTNEDVYAVQCPTRYVTEEEFKEMVKGE